MEESTLKTLIIGWVALTAIGCAGTYVYEEMQKKSKDKTETAAPAVVEPETVAPAAVEEETPAVEAAPAEAQPAEVQSSNRSERRHYNEDYEYDHYGDDIDF